MGNMTTWKINNLDVLEWCKTYQGEPFHAMFCDPPYELKFMSKSWDGTGIAFRPETWYALGRHLYDGAFIMAYAGTRGYHRMAVAIEDAGFILHPVIVWVQGQGFPKATRIDTQIDKYGGDPSRIKKVCEAIKSARESHGMSISDADRLFCNGSTMWSFYEGRRDKPLYVPNDETFSLICGQWEELTPLKEQVKAINREVVGKLDGTFGYQMNGERWNKRDDITAPATDLAEVWQGHRYGLQALKPSVEMICVAQKPYRGRPVDNITETGAGALWIDGARIGTGDDRVSGGLSGSSAIWNEDADSDRLTRPTGGRWPANLVLQHSDECRKIGTKTVKVAYGQPKERTTSDGGMFKGEKEDKPIGLADKNGMEEVSKWECVEGCPIREMDGQSGDTTRWFNKPRDKSGKTGRELFGEHTGNGSSPILDSGGASRYFLNSDWSYEIAEQIGEAAPFMYTPKASRGERDAGLEGMLDHDIWTRDTNAHGEMAIFEEMGGRRPSKNTHPTVKPISLNKWLTTLLLPPDKYAPRRLLQPFSGSGSESIGALLAGWDDITMIDQDTEYGYVEISEARLKHWHETHQKELNKPRQFSFFD